jgi:hypothetical protein
VSSFFDEMTRLREKLTSEDELNGVKSEAAGLLAQARSRLDTAEYQRLLRHAIPIFSASCGCAEDLEYVFSVLDPLLEKRLIDKGFVESVVAESACNRWL